MGNFDQVRHAEPRSQHRPSRYNFPLPLECASAARGPAPAKPRLSLCFRAAPERGGNVHARSRHGLSLAPSIVLCVSCTAMHPMRSHVRHGLVSTLLLSRWWIVRERREPRKQRSQTRRNLPSYHARLLFAHHACVLSRCHSLALFIASPLPPLSLPEHSRRPCRGPPALIRCGPILTRLVARPHPPVRLSRHRLRLCAALRVPVACAPRSIIGKHGLVAAASHARQPQPACSGRRHHLSVGFAGITRTRRRRGSGSGGAGYGARGHCAGACRGFVALPALKQHASPQCGHLHFLDGKGEEEIFQRPMQVDRQLCYLPPAMSLTGFVVVPKPWVLARERCSACVGPLLLAAVHVQLCVHACIVPTTCTHAHV